MEQQLQQFGESVVTIIGVIAIVLIGVAALIALVVWAEASLHKGPRR